MDNIQLMKDKLSLKEARKTGKITLAEYEGKLADIRTMQLKLNADYSAQLAAREAARKKKPTDQIIPITPAFVREVMDQRQKESNKKGGKK